MCAACLFFYRGETAVSEMKKVISLAEIFIKRTKNNEKLRKRDYNI